MTYVACHLLFILNQYHIYLVRHRNVNISLKTSVSLSICTGMNQCYVMAPIRPTRKSPCDSLQLFSNFSNHSPLVFLSFTLLCVCLSFSPMFQCHLCLISMSLLWVSVFPLFRFQIVFTLLVNQAVLAVLVEFLSNFLLAPLPVSFALTDIPCMHLNLFIGFRKFSTTWSVM